MNPHLNKYSLSLAITLLVCFSLYPVQVKEVDLINDDLKYDTCDFNSSSDNTSANSTSTTENTSTDSTNTNITDNTFNNSTDSCDNLMDENMDHLLFNQEDPDDNDANINNWDTILENNHTPINTSNSEQSCSFDLNLKVIDSNSQTSSDNADTANKSNESDLSNDPLKDSAIDQRRQEIESNHAMQANNIPQNPRILRELSIPKETILYLRDVQGRTFDSDLILNKIHHAHELKTALNSPIIEARIKRISHALINSHIKKGTEHLRQGELNFLASLKPGAIGQLLIEQTYHPDFSIANNAFTQLKNLWHTKREHTFLIHNLTNGTGESGFINFLGIDVMQIVERDFITRQDYIDQHADAQVIKEYKEYSLMLQKKGVRNSLYEEKNRLYQLVVANGNKTDTTTNICFAIAQKALFDPITPIFYIITHAPAIETARQELENLEIQVLEQAKQRNLTLTSEITEWLIKEYGYDILEETRDCYISRADYVNTADNQSVLSDSLGFIVYNLKYQTLPKAHSELIHLQKQINDGLECRNITDPTEQKERIIKDFGLDILNLAKNIYKERSDHINLLDFFMPINVPNSSIDILNNHHDYASVGQELDVLAGRVFDNAKLCKLDYIPEIEAHVLDSLHIIKAPSNDAEFVFNVTIVDHVLTDIQSQADAIVKGEPPLLDRVPELFSRAVGKFINGLNPVTQVKSLGELLAGGIYVSYKILEDIINQNLYPNLPDKNFDLKMQACGSLINAARFTSDLIIGDLYLSKEEYLQRHATFWKDYGSKITAENVVDLTAQIAADFVFFKGLTSTFIYLKEIDAVSKLEGQFAKVADTFKKGVDTHLATAEGTALQMSNDLKGAGGAIKNSSLGQKIILRVNNMTEFFELPFGQTLYPHSLKTPYRYQNAVYRLTQDIPGTKLKEGYFYYLDGLHGDHIEVFNKQLKAVGVYNLDGTSNLAKFEAAKKAGRNIKKFK